MHDDQALNLKSVWQLAKSVARNVIKTGPPGSPVETYRHKMRRVWPKLELLANHEVPPLGEEQMAALREVIRATAAVS